MNASVLVTFTIVMVTAMQSTSGVNLLTEKRRYCGRDLVSSLLKACGIGQFPQTGNARKRNIGLYIGGKDKILSQQEALLELYQMGAPLSEFDATNLPSADLPATDKRRLAINNNPILIRCCRHGCSLLYMIGLCN
ncbi:hypothetical protein LSH36_788g02012 [Paralvinella palmiformis]|uniref:Insulin-like domain-containing protein n=1 Tax=Paralvinella palmiformis TaxID=53620 RepID=A0AAD9J0I2_9ANNE|nr:hypothetical protein LSH36_788g02012 [Paralvinella palmiformis]